jgi:hypothetical protein
MTSIALELRPNCEHCDRDLPPESTEARICSYECTYCATCVEHVLHDVCPNCGGGFAPRPVRPKREWRPGLSLAQRPPSSVRVRSRHGLEEIQAFSALLRNTPPERR